VTASLDPTTAASVVESLIEHQGETTIVAVTHKPLLSVYADQVFEVSDRCVELVSEDRTSVMSVELSVV
jgi:ABC-type lipoprotein export system ATPase subunit